jgi:hypothetical protein
LIDSSYGRLVVRRQPRAQPELVGAGCRRHPVSTEDEHRCRGADTRTDRELAGRHDGDQDRDGVRERGIHADHVQQQPVAKDLAEDGKQDERA